MGIFDFFKKNKVTEQNMSDGIVGNDNSLNNQTNGFSFDNFEKDLPEQQENGIPVEFAIEDLKETFDYNESFICIFAK